MKRKSAEFKNQNRGGRIGLCMGLVLLFCCLGFASAQASVLELPSALTQIADEAFMNDTSITSVVIPEGTTSIGARAFAGCGNLENIKVPDSVTTISEDAFDGCDTLFIECSEDSAAAEYAQSNGIAYGKRINTVVPDGLEYTVYDNYAAITGYTGIATELIIPDQIQGVPVTEIARNAFDGCSLTKLVIPDTVEAMAYLGECKNLTQVNFPKNWTTVVSATGPFAGFTSLESISVPEGVTRIPSNAFRECTSLMNIDLPDGLLEIGKEAFAACGFEKIWIPNSTKIIEPHAFVHCTALSEVNYPLSLESCVIREGGGYTGGSPFQGCTSLKEITVPEGVTYIPKMMFIYAEYLERVYLPDTLKSIEEWAFNQCIALQSIQMSDTLESIGFYAFEGCTSLKDILLPDSVYSISSGAFMGSGLEQMIIPKGVTALSWGVFSGCENLARVYIPDTVTSIETDTFSETREDLIIYGISGSYAETYAAENGIAFSTEPFPGMETEEETITLSGSVTFADGTPVEDAYIYVYDTVAEDWISLEYTDRNGAWACSVPADGSYTIHYLHDVYTIEPAEVSVNPTVDMTLDTAIAALVGGEGTATPVFAMQMNGAEIPAEGVKVGDVVTFSITAEGATKVRLVADGVAYNEYWLTDGSAEIERSFTRAGTRQIAFQAYDGSDWGAVCEAQTLIVTADGTLDAPVIHAVDTQYVGESFTVTWDAVDNAESYTVYLYRNGLLWPALSNTDRSTTTGLSMEIPGDLLYTDGEYLIEIIASGYGYSQSSSSITFTVEETAAGVEITYPTEGMTYNVGDTMHTRYAMGSSTQGVRLLVTPPVGEPVLYAPDESGIFYPIADQVGEYVLTPYYSTGEGDFTADTADGTGESVTVTVQKPEISSLTQGTNEQFSIRYTETAQEFAGSVSNARYTVKVYLNDALVQEITPEDGKFAFTTDVLTEMGKYVYAFVPYYGDIAGEPKEFPVYMVEQETESITKYAGEPMMLLSVPDGSVEDSIAYGTEVTILGTYETEYLYVSANDKDGFIAADSKLVDALEPSEMNINVECLTDVPYTKLGESRQYKITANGAKSVYANLMQENVSVGVYEGEATTDGFIVTIPAENAGAYIATFYAVTMDDQVAYYVCGLPLLMVDASGDNAGKECWSNHSKMLTDAMSIYTQSDAEFDVTTCKMYVVGTINNNLVCIQRTMNDGSLKYAVVDASKIRYTKNVTEYRAVCIVNPYEKDTYIDDSCMGNCRNIVQVFERIGDVDIILVRGKESDEIDAVLELYRNLADYNDITYIYWSGHGSGQKGVPDHYWNILPVIAYDNKGKPQYSDYHYAYLVDHLTDGEDGRISWEGKINIVIDSCYSGAFADTLTEKQINEDASLAVLMSTQNNEPGLYNDRGGKFTVELTEFVNKVSDKDLTLSNIASNINVFGWSLEIESVLHWPKPSIFGDPNRIFFAEDPEAVN